YTEAWLPTFVMAKRQKICIFDFFAGTGYDKNGVAGSPIRVLRQISHQKVNILQNGTRVHLFLNGYDTKKQKRQEKFELLQQACAEYLGQDPDLARCVKLEFYSEDCATLFGKLLPDVKAHPSLVFLDQNGVKFLADKYLLELEKLRETDFLYYASSSYFWRLGETPEFKAHVPLDIQAIKRAGYERVHRSVIEQLRGRLPKQTPLRLYPFSIRKDQNIFGVIFGATHPLAVDKFLTISWKRNSANGEADFDIDGEVGCPQLDMFTPPKIKKVDQFKESVCKKILSGEITCNFELLDYVYAEGHICTHAKEAMMSLKSKGFVDYEARSPLVTYENVHEKKRLLKYTVLNKGS
ncbi:MAG: three-Cys-motif partner protein TcmP, partial [Chitinophagaceae bacterium]